MKKDIVLKVAGQIYERLRKRKIAVFLFPPQVKRDLSVLNQEERTYYVQKLMQLLCVCLIFLLAICFGIRNAYVARSTQVKTIERPKLDAKSTEITLQVAGGEAYTVEVSSRILTQEEAKAVFDEFSQDIEQHILGSNQSAMEITKDLALTDSIPGYPFTIYWESEKEHIIDNVGNVYRERLERDELVTITAICTYMENQWETELCVRVLKEELLEEERYKRELEQYLIEDEKNSRHSEVWNLPEHFDGKSVQYRLVPKWDKFIILGSLILVAGLFLWIGNDKDIHNARKKRQELFEADYLNFVSSLSLYISAGLNLQTALKYCVKDYERKRPAKDMLREALLGFEKDLLNGYSFQSALDMFADRADHSYYKRLAGLLQQGLLNGTSDLAITLRQEVDKIREDKRRQCKMRGDKMSSALIAPMLLQLCIVMALIMLPAFSNMQF